MVTGVTDITGEVEAESLLTARDCASLLDTEDPGVASMVEMSVDHWWRGRGLTVVVTYFAILKCGTRLQNI